MHDYEGKEPFDLVDSRLRRMIAGCRPLVEIGGTLKLGVSAEVVCEIINRLDEGLAAYCMGSPTEVWGRRICIQLNPQRASFLGVVLARVPLNPAFPEAGFKWHCYSFGSLESVSDLYLDYFGLSQPGSFDEGQPWPTI